MPRGLKSAMADEGPHEATIAAVIAQDGSIKYSLNITTSGESYHALFETLESALDSFNPLLTPRVRSHIVEGLRCEGKPVVFCLEDAVEKTQP